MRIAYPVLGLTFAALGIWSFVDGYIAKGVFWLAISVAWLLIAAFKGRRSASHSQSDRDAA